MRSQDFVPRKHLTFALLMLGGCLGLAAPVAGQTKPATVEAIAQYQGADRQQMLEAGARQEGSLLLYTTGTQIQPLIDRFKEKYPFIKVEVARAGSADAARKVIEEYAAGYYKVDAYELASHGLIVPRDHGLLQPFTSPELGSYDPDAIEPNKHWVVARESYTGLGFNTNLVPPDQAPKTYEDLLAPQWKGKMAMSGSTANSGNWVGTLVILHGEDFVRKMGDQNIRVYKITGRALANLMTSGEVALSPTIYNSHVEASATKSAPLAWRALGPVPVTDSGVALAKRAPHPHAAMLMVDFMLSKEGQEMYRELGYDSARTDMKSADSPPQKLYLSNRPNYIEEFEQWNRLFQTVFLNRKR
jgi:iron(III) transport system substrate-binding protein